MNETAAFACAPAHVRALDFGHVLVLIDYRTGAVRCLLPAAAARWRQAARTGCTKPLGETLAARMLAARLLIPVTCPTPWPEPAIAHTAAASWGSTEHPSGIVKPEPTPYWATLFATAALATVFAFKHAGPRQTALARLSALIKTASASCRHQATYGQVEAALKAVRRAGWHSPGRTACLEESTAAVLLLAARRLAVSWCHGVAADPVRLHAWVQTVDGRPVAEPLSTNAYIPTLTITGGHHHQHP